ncbi:inosose dehydratase [Klebsiella pneumoniae]|nr:inosose dehydratase [Klebsiella pneumoniae]
MAESVGAGQVRRQGDRRDASLPAAVQRVVHRGMVIAEDDDPLTLLAAARNAPGQRRWLRLRDKGAVQGQTAIAEAIRHGGKILRQLRKEERVIAAEKDLNLPGKAVLLRQLGAKVMVYGECGQLPGETPLDEPISLSPPLSRVSLAAYCHKLNTFADLLLRDYDLQLAYHHHLMMLVEHDDELERFLSHTHDNVGLAFDTGHAFVAGVEIPRVLHKYGHRIRHLHLKDVRPQVLGRLYRENLSFNEAVRAGLFTIPGDGCIDYAPILDFVRDSDYRGWLIIEAEQDPAMAPPLATASRAYAWLAHHLSSPSSSEEYAS